MWQPIETAPKRTLVLVYGEVPGYGHHRITLARYWEQHTLEVPCDYEDEDWVERDEHGDAYWPADWYEEVLTEDAPLVNLKPTHWMPLPQAPQT